jgi:hypothetical protein
MRVLEFGRPSVYLAVALVACGPSTDGRVQFAASSFSEQWEKVASIKEEGWSRGTPSAITSADLLSDGSIVIADNADNTLRLYDSLGHFVQSLGRHGRGPGEFVGLRWVGVMRGDTMVTYSMSYQELSLWTRDGVASRRTRATNVPWGVLPSGMLKDGSILFASVSTIRPRLDAPQRRRSVDSSGAVLLKRPDYTPLSTAALPQAMVIRDRDFAAQLPFAPRLYGTTCDTLAFASWNADSSLRIFDANAQQVLSLPIGMQAVPIPDGVWDKAIGIDDGRPDPDGWKERARRLRQSVEPAKTYPRHAGIVAESCDRIWIREYENTRIVTARDTATFARWIAFDLEGRPTEEMLLPATANILRINEQRLLIRLRDEDDVPTLYVYRRR